MERKDDIAGWVVRITTKAKSGKTAVLYAVADKSPDEAVQTAKVAMTATADEKVEAVDRLSSADITVLGLRPGEIHRY